MQTKQQNMQIIMAYLQHIKGDNNVQGETFEQDIHSQVLQEGHNQDKSMQTSNDNVYNVNEKSKELSEN